MIAARAKQGQKGQTLFMAIILLLALTFLGLGLIMLAAIDSQTSRNLRLGEEAMSAAEEGVMYGLAVSGDHEDKPSMIEGDSVTYDSYKLGYTKPFPSFVVTVIVGGPAEAPRGEMIGESGSVEMKKFRIVWIQSTGAIDTGDGQIQRKIEVTARVREL